MDTPKDPLPDSEVTERMNHLALLQSIINRMGTNSFLIKGWAVTLVSALLAFGAKDANATFAMLAMYPAVAFWGLDAYYLMLERKYRATWQTDAEAFKCGFSLARQPTPPTDYASAITAPAVWPLYASIALVVGLVAGKLLLHGK